jgi:hypothetical protein
MVIVRIAIPIEKLNGFVVFNVVILSDNSSDFRARGSRPQHRYGFDAIGIG